MKFSKLDFIIIFILCITEFSLTSDYVNIYYTPNTYFLIVGWSYIIIKAIFIIVKKCNIFKIGDK